jgi:hypothetical protein
MNLNPFMNALSTALENHLELLENRRKGAYLPVQYGGTAVARKDLATNEAEVVWIQ